MAVYMRGRRQRKESENGFDGVSGSEGLRVVFGNGGQVDLVRAFDAVTGQEAVPYRRCGSRWSRSLVGDYGEATPIGRDISKAIETARTRRQG